MDFSFCKEQAGSLLLAFDDLWEKAFRRRFLSLFGCFIFLFAFFTFCIWHYWSRVDALCFAVFVLYVQYMRDDASCATCRASGLAKSGDLYNGCIV